MTGSDNKEKEIIGDVRKLFQEFPLTNYRSSIEKPEKKRTSNS